MISVLELAVSRVLAHDHTHHPSMSVIIKITQPYYMKYCCGVLPKYHKQKAAL